MRRHRPGFGDQVNVWNLGFRASEGTMMTGKTPNQATTRQAADLMGRTRVTVWVIGVINLLTKSP